MLRLNRNYVVLVVTFVWAAAPAVGCSGSVSGENPAAGGASQVGGSQGGASQGGTAHASGGYTSLPGTGGVATGGLGTTLTSSAKGGSNTGGTPGPIGGVGSPTGTCPANAVNQACGSMLKYCITSDSQTCACYQGSWTCFGP